MINDILVEAMDMMIEMCSNEQQKQGMDSLKEFICDFYENEWTDLSTSEQQEKIRQYLSKE